MNRVTVFDQTMQKTYEWLHELSDELGWNDSQRAYVGLRSTLHTLRDRLAVDEAADLGAQLPLLVRGIYFEGWDPSSTPVRVRHVEDFLRPIGDALFWEQRGEPERVARAVFALLSRHLAAGEIDDVVGTLPHEIRDLFPADVVARHAAVSVHPVH